MQNGRVVVALHSLTFRVHTRVLLTLFVACAIAGIMWADAPALEPVSAAVNHTCAPAHDATQLRTLR